MAPRLLAALCTAFTRHPAVARCDDSSGAYDQCDATAHAFAAFCRRRHVPAQVLRLQLRGEPTLFPRAHAAWRALLDAEATVYHTVTVVECGDARSWCVDWSARQFDPAAGFPQITQGLPAPWHPPLDPVLVAAVRAVGYRGPLT